MIGDKFSLQFHAVDSKGKIYRLLYGEQAVLECTDDEKDFVNELVYKLNDILIENEIEAKAYLIALEFYQKIIMDTLSDKLSDIDNMYAMKKMMDEICHNIEGLYKNLSDMRDDGIDGEFDEK